ncbi:MAG: OPT family oligopeptide transporter [Lachnospirales bacterium]
MKKIKELTPVSIITGIILAVVFSGANAYLGLRVGMTVSASIPAAVISMGVIRIILKRESVLENNMVQTIGSAGESIAAGAIFTLPTLFMWANEWGSKSPSLFEIFIISLCGGLLGVLFMIPLRKILITNKKENLPYPEGTACAEVLMAGESKGMSAVQVFRGLGISGIYKFVCDGLKLFPSELHFDIPKYKGGAIGINILPALTGVGYICGYKIASYMLGGGIISWLVLMPLLSFFGNENIIFPQNMPISSLTTNEIWSGYIRYIGAGAVAVGGIISLIKSLPIIFNAFTNSFKNINNNSENNNEDISYKIIIPSITLLVLIIWLIPEIPVSLLGALSIAIFGFFFATVSSRLVGLVGSSNNPVSGMTISTLLICTFILKIRGYDIREGMIGAIAIGSIICIISAISGDTSQDLKTGHIIGATPYKQQIGEFIGVLASAITIGGILYLFNKAWGYGSIELPAPQATLMKLVVEGVMDGNLPWMLVGIGGFIAVMAEIIGIPVLPFCIGLYLPIHLSMGIMSGGLIRLYCEQRKNNDNLIRNGVLFSSGMIAGEGLVGIILALMAVIPIGGIAIGEIIDLSRVVNIGTIGALIIFMGLIFAFLSSIKKE